MVSVGITPAVVVAVSVLPLPAAPLTFCVTVMTAPLEVAETLPPTTALMALAKCAAIRIVPVSVASTVYVAVCDAATVSCHVTVATSPVRAVSYTHLRAHETRHDLVCRLLLEKKKKR